MSVLRSYLKLVSGSSRAAAQFGLRRDAAQVLVAERMDALLDELRLHKVALNKYTEEQRAYNGEVARQAEAILQMKKRRQEKEAALPLSHDRHLYGGDGEDLPMAPLSRSGRGGDGRGKLEREAFKEARQLLGPPPRKPTAPKSLYLHGQVGVGKTFLMDLFYENAQALSSAENDSSSGPPAPASLGIGSTRRLHFNAAMMELHAHMHRIEQNYYQRDKFKGRGDPGKLAVMAARRRRQDASRNGGHQFGATSSFTVSQTLEKASKALFRLDPPAQPQREGPSGGPISSLSPTPDPHLGLVCFDELQVPDGFTAIAVMSMFRLLFREEAVVISTSNCAPHELNDQAWFNDHYTNFTQLLLDRCDVIEVDNGGVDYRTVAFQESRAKKTKRSGAEGDAKDGYESASSLEREGALSQQFPRFFCGASSDVNTSLLNAYIRGEAAGGSESESGRGSAEDAEVVLKSIEVMFGRSLQVPTVSSGVAKIDFQTFFGNSQSPIGPADCLAIAHNFKVVCVENIPVLNRSTRDLARRFILMVDELYNEGCLLLCTASAPPEELFKSDELGESLLDLEALQFEAEALTDAKSRTDSNLVGGVSPKAALQRISSEEGGTAKLLAKKMTGEEEQFAFKRAVSRIIEMQSDMYFERHKRMHSQGKQF